MIRAQGMERRVAVVSVDQTAMDAFRSACPKVATAATKDEVVRFVGLSTVFLGPLFVPRAEAFQVPEKIGRWSVLTPGFAQEARRLNMKVEVWTVNETEDMKRLLRLPVDGIMTDYPDRLLAVLGR
jgi:glycerophosphoryl diester phosphodiesterase